MRKMASKFVGLVQRHKAISIVTTIMIVLVGWWIIATYIPHPLGDKLVYLGKENLGGIIFSDSKPYSVYYYATDMTVQDVERYFKNAQPAYPSDNLGPYTQIWLKNGASNQTATLYYYDASSVSGYHTTKKHIIKMRDNDYTKLSAAL